MPMLAQNFEEYLVKNSEVSNVTLRNYRADLANFLTWTQTFLARRGVTVLNDSSLVSQFSPFLIKEYVKSQTLESTPPATINRRLSSLRSFGKFLVSSGYVKDNPFSSFPNLHNPKSVDQKTQLTSGSENSENPIVRNSENQTFRNSDTPTIRNTDTLSYREAASFAYLTPRKVTYALAIVASVLLLVSLTQTYFLIKKSPAKTKTTVLGAAETGYRTVSRRFPLPAPSITFGDLLKKGD